MRKLPAGKVRINVDITPIQKAVLEDLQIRSEASSLIEVIRRALVLYNLAITAKEQNCSLILESQDGRQKEIVIL